MPCLVYVGSDCIGASTSVSQLPGGKGVHGLAKYEVDIQDEWTVFSPRGQNNLEEFALQVSEPSLRSEGLFALHLPNEYVYAGVLQPESGTAQRVQLRFWCDQPDELLKRMPDATPARKYAGLEVVDRALGPGADGIIVPIDSALGFPPAATTPHGSRATARAASTAARVASITAIADGVGLRLPPIPPAQHYGAPVPLAPDDAAVQLPVRGIIEMLVNGGDILHFLLRVAWRKLGAKRPRDDSPGAAGSSEMETTTRDDSPSAGGSSEIETPHTSTAMDTEVSAAAVNDECRAALFP